MPTRFIPLILCCILLMACTKLTQENYLKLQAGMSRIDVAALLGSPAQCSGVLGLSSCTWGDERGAISVQFAADKVVLYSGKGLK
jgi:hypothetical protein